MTLRNMFFEATIGIVQESFAQLRYRFSLSWTLEREAN